jgi:CRP/FNR family nitrogen fixation transcriptional regulator
MWGLGMTSQTALAIAPDLRSSADRAQSASIFDHLREQAIRVRYDRGNVIAAEYAPVTQIHFILTGCARLCRHLPGDSRPIADFLFAGSLLGAGTASHYTFAVEAVTPVTALAYSKAQFIALCESNPRIRNEVATQTSATLARAQDHLFLLNSLGARQRVAAFLLRLFQHKKLVYGDRLDLPMGRRDIADYLGLTIETVSRALAFLRDHQIIELRNSQLIVVKDAAALAIAAAQQNLTS